MLCTSGSKRFMRSAFQPVELPETGFEEGRNPHTDRMGRLLRP